MIAPDGRNLPVATGAAAMGMSGGDRPESVTSDTAARSVGTSTARASKSEPREPDEHVDPVAQAPAAPEVEVQGNPDTGPAQEEIDQLHARFDKMETLLKQRLAIATLHARFDALEAWLAERFPGLITHEGTSND